MTSARARAQIPAWVTLLGVVLVAVNPRPAIAAVSPLLPLMQAEVGLSRGAAGFLTTVPVLCFGGLAAASAALGQRIGSERALMIAMLAVAAGSAVRAIPTVPWVFVGTFVIGAAITVGNVLVPSVIKQHFAVRPGPVTGLYTAALLGGAALAAGVSAPLAGAGLGWRGSLLVWAIPAVLAVIAWLPSARHPSRPSADAARSVSPLRSVVTWALAVFMGSQSLLYFAVLAWLPTLLQDAGISAGQAGLALSLFNLLGIATALVMPSLAARWPDQRVLAWLICLAWAIGVSGLLLYPDAFLLWSSSAGMAQGAAISLVFTLIVLRSQSPDAARALSGTVQSLGYLIGATGPILMGVLRDATSSWTTPLIVLLGSVGLMAVSAFWAGRNTTLTTTGSTRAAPGESERTEDP